MHKLCEGTYGGIWFLLDVIEECSPYVIKILFNYLFVLNVQFHLKYTIFYIKVLRLKLFIFTSIFLTHLIRV